MARSFIGAPNPWRNACSSTIATRIKREWCLLISTFLEKHGFAAQSRHLGKPFAYLFTKSGDVNTLVHMWLYDDVADRAKKRAAMAADPEIVGRANLHLNNEEPDTWCRSRTI